MAFDLSEDQLESTEADVGAVFPQSYRQRMMRSNGGEVFANADYWTLIPIRNKSERKRLSRTASHVLAETKSFSEWSIWHDNAYVIAENETGDTLVIIRKGQRFEPQVFNWRYENGDLELIAEDVTELASDL